MKLDIDLKVEKSGVDKLDYSIFKKKNTFIAKVKVKIKNQFFYIRKTSNDLGELLKSLNISLKNLKSKRSGQRKRYAKLHVYE
jgi:hypothetical protein